MNISLYLMTIGAGSQPGPQLNTKLLRHPSLTNPATSNYYWPNNIPPPPPFTMMTMGGCNLSAPHTQQPPSPNYAQQNSPTTTTSTTATSNGSTTNGPLHPMINIPPPITPSLLKNNFSFPSAYPMNAFNENVLVRYCNSSDTMDKGTEYNDDVAVGRRSTTTVEEDDQQHSSDESIADGEHNIRQKHLKKDCGINDSSDTKNDNGGRGKGNDIELSPMVGDHRIIITGPDDEDNHDDDDDVFDENKDKEEEEDDGNDNELCLMGNRTGSDNYPSSNEGTHLLLSS